MSTSSREKQALGVFIVLVVLGFCGLCWYLVAGHSWNVAASAIDEKVGQMDGYTAIVYAGTVLPEAEPVASSASASSSAQSASDSASAASTSSSQTLGSGTSPSKKKNAALDSDVADARSDAASGLTSDVDSIAAPVVPNASGSAAIETEKSSAAEENTSTSSNADSAAARSGLTSKKADPVDPDDVCSSYQGKGAQVLVLDTAHPYVYEDGAILKRGQKRIGVFSVDVPLSEEAAQERIAYFKDAKVDMIVCISSVRSYVRNVQGIDIVITLQDDDVSTMGANSGGTFYVNAPEMDTVGAILVSPSNVVSAKVVESL